MMADFFNTIYENATAHVEIASNLRNTMQQLVSELEKNASVTRWFRRRVTHNKTIDRLIDDLTEKKINIQKALDELNAQEDNQQANAPVLEDEPFNLSQERQELEENYESVIGFLNDAATQIEDGEDPAEVYELNYGLNAEYINNLKSFVNQPLFESFDKLHQVTTFTDTATELNAVLARMRDEDEEQLKARKRAVNGRERLKKVLQDNQTPDELQEIIDRLSTLTKQLEAPREALLNTSGAEVIENNQVESWQRFIESFNRIAQENESGANLELLENAGDPTAIESLHGELKGAIAQIRGFYPMKIYSDLMNVVTKIAHDISAQRGARAFNNRIEEVTESANTSTEIFNSKYWQITGMRHQHIGHRTVGEKQVGATHPPVKTI